MDNVPMVAVGFYRMGHAGKAFIRGLMLLVMLLCLLPRAESAEWVPVTGKVMFGDTPLCAMVLANGQNKFSCSGDGSFNMMVPLDGNGKVTLFTFAQGFAPYRQTLFPAQVTNKTVNMERETKGRSLTVQYGAVAAARAGWAVVNGTIDFNGSPVCSLMLANGQHMFSCNNELGRFSLEVPLDSSGNVTLFAFVSGFQPFKIAISEIGYLKFVEGNPGMEDDGIFITSSQENPLFSTRYWFTTDPKPLVGNLNDGVTITVITKLPRDEAYAQIYYEFGYLGTQCLVKIHDNDVIRPYNITAEATFYSLDTLSSTTQNVRNGFTTGGAEITNIQGCSGAEVSKMFFNRIEFLNFGLDSIELDAAILDPGLVKRFVNPFL